MIVHELLSHDISSALLMIMHEILNLNTILVTMLMRF